MTSEAEARSAAKASTLADLPSDTAAGTDAPPLGAEVGAE